MADPGNLRGTVRVRSSLSKQIRSCLKHLVRNPDAPPAPFLQTTFTSGKRHYGLRAFLLNHQPGQRSPHVAVLLERINPSRLDCSKAQRLFGLSRREGEVIHHLELGLTDKEIASALGIGSETVRAHLKNIRVKLSVSTRTAILNKLLSL